MKRSSLVSNTDKSVANSFNNTFNDYEPLGSDHDQAPEVQAPSLDAGSSSASHLTERVSVLSDMYVLGTKLINGSSTTICKFAFIACMIKE